MEFTPVLGKAAGQMFGAGSFVPLTIGPNFQQPFSEFDLLSGFKLNIEEGENPFKAKIFDAPNVDIPFTTQFTESRIIDSEQSFKEMTEISGSLSVSYGLVSGKGSGEFLQSMVGSTRSSSIMYRTRHAAYAKVFQKGVGGLTPIAEVQEMISQGRMDELTEKYGTKFIEQIVYGAQLDVVYTVTAREDTDLQKIMAELEGKIGVGPLSIKFRAKFEKQEGETESELNLFIQVKASGVTFTTPSNPGFDQTNDLINSFNTEYTKMVDEIVDDINNGRDTAVLSQMSPVGFVLGSIADHVDSLDQYEMAVLDSRMADAGSVLQEALFTKARLQEVMQMLQTIYIDPREREEVYEPYQDQVLDVVSSMDEKVDECLAYRRLSIAQIIGRGSQLPEPIPQYVESDYEDIVEGLCGKGYISSPLTILGSTFNGMHYIGYTMQDLDSDMLVPWMSGRVRLDDDDSIIGIGNSPHELLEMAKRYESPKAPKFFSGFERMRYEINREYGANVGEMTKFVRFPQSFETHPDVTIFLQKIDMGHLYNYRYRCEDPRHSTTKEGFNIRCWSWDDTRIWEMKVAWFANTPELAYKGQDEIQDGLPYDILLPEQHQSEYQIGGAAIVGFDMSNTVPNVELDVSISGDDILSIMWLPDNWSAHPFMKQFTWFILNNSILQTGIKHFYDFPSTESNLQQQYVEFDPPFDNIPSVVVGLCGFDFDLGENIRIDTRIEDGSLTTSGMIITAETWGYTSAQSFTVRWVAGPQG